MLRPIIGGVGGFIVGGTMAVLVIVTAPGGRTAFLGWEPLALLFMVGGGAMAGPCAIIGATSAILEAIRAAARGHIE